MQLFRRSLEVVLVVDLEDVDVLVLTDRGQVQPVRREFDVEDLLSRLVKLRVLFPVDAQEYLPVQTPDREYSAPVLLRQTVDRRHAVAHAPHVYQVNRLLSYI